MTTIDWTKPVETDEDPPRPVRVLCTDFKGHRSPYLCAIDCGEFEMFMLFNSQGVAEGGVTRLRNVQPKHSIVMEKRWVNVYPDNIYRANYETKRLADHAATSDRVGCLEIDWPVAVVDEPEVDVEKTCVSCKYSDTPLGALPCNVCSQNYESQWEPKP